MPLHIPQKELLILKWLARGWSYTRIQDHMGISAATLHTYCHRIRTRTGIRDTRDQRECMEFVRTVSARPKPLNPLPVTPGMLEYLQLYAHGFTYAEIAASTGSKIQTAKNAITVACKRVNIHNQIGPHRVAAVRSYLTRLDGSTGADPMADPMFN